MNTLKEAKKLVKKWRKIMCLDTHWNIDIEVNVDATTVEEDCRDAIAFVHTDEAYWRATVIINEYMLTDNLEEIVVHELGHIFLARLSRLVECGLGETFQEEARVAIESTNEKLTKALLEASKPPKPKKARIFRAAPSSSHNPQSPVEDAPKIAPHSNKP